MITPLIKRNKDGELYERLPAVTTALERLSRSPRKELLRRVAIRDRNDPDYVSGECLVHHIRASRMDNSVAWFEQLHKILMERIWRSLPKAEGSDGTLDLTKERIRALVFDKFGEMLLADRALPGDGLDFFEVRFDLGIKRMRLDAQDKAWREENRKAVLDDEEIGGQPVVAGFGSNLPDEDIFSDPLFRDRLYEAIDALPPDQSRTMYLTLLGWPTESNDPEVMTIAKALGCSDRSVRTYRACATKAILALFHSGEYQ